MYAGAIGLFIGLLFVLIFITMRVRWIIGLLSKREAPAPRVLSGLTKLILILFWTACFGLILFLGFFLRTYHAFTHEDPVAEIRVQAIGRGGLDPVSLVHLSSPHIRSTRHLFIRGDQWMIEGDILKWENWLNFLGLHTRYRLTRFRGRYLDADEERRKPPLIYSLVALEKHPLWRHLYQYGHQLPFISSVYGNAAFQDLGRDKTYLIFMGTSGFIVREKKET